MGLNILVAPDKFKGSLSAFEVCEILKLEISTALSDAIIELCPMADGGEGSVEILARYLKLEKQECSSVDPLGRAINTSYYTSGKMAYIELASASGLTLLEESERNPMVTSTFGTGLLIKHAVDNGAEHIYLFLGGSATNDGGMGIASALGFRFYDKHGFALNLQGSSLNLVDKIEPPAVNLPIKKLTLCCDVENPPFGIDGAAHVYAKQKGANEEELIELDLGLQNLCEQIKEYNGLDLSELRGGGAAGGVALCLSGLMKAEIVSGFEMIAKASGLESKIAESDLVIGGEGRLDGQSMNGKAVSGVAEICKKRGKRFWLVVGENELNQEEEIVLGVEKIFAIMDVVENKEMAMSNPRKYFSALVNEMIHYL